MYRLIAPITFGLLLVCGDHVSAQTISPNTVTINKKIAEKWEEAGIKQPAKRSTDLEFLRRVFIDLIGRIATPEEVSDFENDPTPNKRVRLVKRLLYETKYQPKINGVPATNQMNGKKEPMVFNYAEEYSEHWANIWTVWLMTRSAHRVYREQMHEWLVTEFNKNTPHNELVTKLLTATGRTNENGAVNFIVQHLGDAVPNERQTELGRFDAVPITSRVTRLFLGLQTQCTQCHDHPFNKEWVQPDFWGVNAFFRQTIRNVNPTPGANVNQQQLMNPVQVALSDEPNYNSTGIVFYERRDGKLMAAKPNFLKNFADALEEKASSKTMAAAASQGMQGKTRREVLAHYVTKHDNFGKAFVSRIWGHLFGRGFTKEPSIDDFGSNNEVVHPELLDTLGEEFAKYGYDPKMLLDWICCSDVYQLSHEANPANADQKFNPYFARMPLKAMSPEVLLDSLMVATKAERNPDAAARATLREAWLNRLVRNFGDDEGNEMTFNGTVIQALLMLNGREINEQINRSGNNAVAMAVARNTKNGITSPAKVIDELFVMALNRHATQAEVSTLLEFMKGNRRVTIEMPTSDTPTPPRPNRPAPKQPAPKQPAPKQPATPAGPMKVTGTLAPAAPNDVTFYQDIFWALLNTNEFILNH